MQPTYLPWAGYFNLMSHAEVFVLLDDVQFCRSSWQCRNRILLQGSEHLLTVSLTGVSLGTPICEVRLMPGIWAAKHWATLNAAYGKTAHGPQLLELLKPIYAEATQYTHLVDWNQRLIETLARALLIETPLVRASNLSCRGQRSSHLLALCDRLGVTEYISPRGSSDYLMEDNFAGNGRIALRYQTFTPAPYAQRKALAFVSHLSVVDVIAQQGLDFARRYVLAEVD
jgi:hypothetical protein